MDALCINLQMFNIEAALFDSLRLLGFDENKFQIQLTPGLFSRANYAAGDALFYFIFSKLRPTQYEAVRRCSRVSGASCEHGLNTASTCQSSLIERERTCIELGPACP